MNDLLLPDKRLIEFNDILEHQVLHNLQDSWLVYIMDHDLIQLLTRSLSERVAL